MTRRTPARSRVPPHLHQATRDLPADHRGRRVCVVCGLLGEPGDAHHPITLPTTPVSPVLAAAAAARDAAILGERDAD
ncbi:hypothetical protein [Solwaraspora sp. WMMD792]|uniref:hypothetical protein n=1 Tax=Solwaraspora sp. WMMD792 TaxID=3016099 RepID=UPI00241778F7|nr:hypothetical protein [Solwaraspora sp. WMMD792]MDG4768755.1 hypothetical protein [Solwaraspora sp. WMMD792]MDG4768794.1 hypothetical protein [Solwaraspora sp. WMMD792]MDG4768834.1 hypothetical protein [Solwaraspora sp. WMMD792]MDG4768850.1 hypothetical protein [Solwaraspora sp. WMMD792]MDG4768883.1 hypothetical protein [Solwaraspora sp. WMMD792]